MSFALQVEKISPDYQQLPTSSKSEDSASAGKVCAKVSSCCKKYSHVIYAVVANGSLAALFIMYY